MGSPRSDARGVGGVPRGGRIAFDAEEVLLVPKLGALASLNAFVAEVERDARSLGSESAVQWVRRAEPIH
jgi:hypothetical protein